MAVGASIMPTSASMRVGMDGSRQLISHPQLLSRSEIVQQVRICG